MLAWISPELLDHGDRPHFLMPALGGGEVRGDGFRRRGGRLAGGLGRSLQAGLGFRGQYLRGGETEEGFGFRAWRFWLGLVRNLVFLRGSGGFGQGAAVLLGGPVAGVGVAAETERHVDGDVVGERKAEGAEGGEAECDDLGDGDQVGVAAGLIAVHGLGGGAAGELDVAGRDAEEHRCEEGDDEGDEDVGGVG